MFIITWLTIKFLYHRNWSITFTFKFLSPDSIYINIIFTFTVEGNIFCSSFEYLFFFFLTLIMFFLVEL